MSEHPCREELWAVCQGGLSPKRDREVLRHLLTPCQCCLEEALSAPSPISGLTLTVPELTPARATAYDDAIDRAMNEALRHERHLRQQAAQAHEILAALEKGGLKAVEKLHPRFEGLARMKAFLARSWQLRHEDPQAMVKFAWFATEVSRTLDPRHYGAARIFDLQTQAYAELGNAYRTADRLHEAGEALGHARQLFELGTREEVLEIRLMELEASLAADRRQYGRAMSMLLKVLEHYQRCDLHLAGRMLVKMGLYSGYAENFKKGIDYLKQGLSQIDSARDPVLAYAAAHNLILLLVDSGRIPEAKKLRLVYSRYLMTPEGRINQLKSRILDARIDAGLGNHKRAETTFREAIQGLEAAELPILAGIERLNLTATLLAQGKAGEAKKLALATAEIFTSLEIQREALQAVILLRNAFEMQKATREMVEEVASFLRRIELDSALRFEGRAWESPDRF